MDMIAVPSVVLAMPTGHTVTLDHLLHTCRDTPHLNACAAVKRLSRVISERGACGGAGQSGSRWV